MTQPLMPVQATFKNLDRAMTFLGTFRYDSQGRPAMNKASETKVLGWEDFQHPLLSGPDGATQQAYLEKTLASMGPLYFHVLMARYTPRRDFCPCCAQPTLSADWLAHVENISNAALAQEVVTSHTMKRQARDGAVRRYFGDELRLQDLADQAEISLRTMTTINARIRAWLGGCRVEKVGDEMRRGRAGVELNAIKMAEQLLHARGHIEKTMHV